MRKLHSTLECPFIRELFILIAQGVPDDVPDRMLGYLADRVRQPGPSSDTVEQILGRPALTFAEWAADHAAAFRD